MAGAQNLVPPISNPQSRIGRGAAIAGGGMLFQQVISFVSGLVVARLLGAADYGLFSLLRNWSMIAVIIGKAGLDLGLTKRLGQRIEKESLADAGRITLAAIAVVMVLSGAIVGLCLVWLGPYLERNVYRFDGFASMFFQMMLIVPLLGGMQVLSAAFRARLEPSPGVIAEMVLQPAVRLLLSTVLIVVGWGVGGAVWGNVLAAFIAILYIGYKATGYFALQFRGVRKSTWEDLAALKGSALTLGISVGVVTLTRSVDLLIVGAYADPSDLGKYAVAQMVAVLVGLGGAAFGQLLGPLIAQYWGSGERALVGALLKKNTRFIVIATAPLLLVLCLFGADLCLIFGADYRIPLDVIALLTISHFASGALANSGWVISMTGRHGSELCVLLIGLIAAVALNFLLVPPFGIHGAAWATLLSVLLANVARVWLVYRYANFLPFDASSLLPLAIAFCLAAPTWLIARIESIGHSLVSGLIGSMIFLALYCVLGYRAILRQEERSAVGRFLLNLTRRAPQ